jgi:hypothetical protein
MKVQRSDSLITGTVFKFLFVSGETQSASNVSCVVWEMLVQCMYSSFPISAEILCEAVRCRMYKCS